MNQIEPFPGLNQQAADAPVRRAQPDTEAQQAFRNRKGCSRVLTPKTHRAEVSCRRKRSKFKGGAAWSKRDYHFNRLHTVTKLSCC